MPPAAFFKKEILVRPVIGVLHPGRYLAHEVIGQTASSVDRKTSLFQMTGELYLKSN